MGFNKGGMNNERPVEVGQEVDVKIETVGEKGDGLAKINGFVLFVPNTKAGQQVRVKITRVLSKVGFAEVVGESESQAEEEEQVNEPIPEAEPSPEDSEDFGEEPGEEDDTESEPANESEEYVESSEEEDESADSDKEEKQE